MGKTPSKSQKENWHSHESSQPPPPPMANLNNVEEPKDHGGIDLNELNLSLWSGTHGLMDNSSSSDDSEDEVIELDDWLDEKEEDDESDSNALVHDDDEEDNQLDEAHEAELSEYLRSHRALYEVMQQVPLFYGLSQNQQEKLLQALKPANFQDGEYIVKQGEGGNQFYMIVRGEALVTKQIKNPQTDELIEINITHLYSGHYFGELALLYDDARTASVRAINSLELMYLTRKDFQRIEQVYLSLMLKQVPVLADLTPRDQDAVLNRLQSAVFSDGEFIVRQGEDGDRFYIITRGEAVITENIEWKKKKDNVESSSPVMRELTRLYEGHCFGETSLVFDEPRSANVQAVGAVNCFYLTKKDFQESIQNSESFNAFIQQAYIDKATTRAMRIKKLKLKRTSSDRNRGSSPQSPSQPPRRRSRSGSITSLPLLPTAVETKTLVTKRLKDGQKIVNKYVIKGDIGRGKFGRVQLGKSEEDGCLYAIKIISKTFTSYLLKQEDSYEHVLRQEVAIMKKLHHPNIVRLIEAIDDPSSHKLYIVQEYISRGNLMEVLQQEYPLSEDRIRKYMHGLLRGLQYLHFHSVIHRDLKPENILVTESDDIKIADFGAARVFLHENETLKDVRGTPTYMAPECFEINAEYIGPAADIWSAGATLFMLVTGHPPWSAENEIELSRKIQHDELVFPLNLIIEPHLKNLLVRMLTKDPSHRITLNQIVQHDWISKEGSAPLSLVMYKESDHVTVSVHEKVKAISNIPTQIDKRFQKQLEEAHHLIKHEQREDGTRTCTSSKILPSSLSQSSLLGSSLGNPNQDFISRWRSHKRAALVQDHKGISDRLKSLLMDQKRLTFPADRAQMTEIIMPLPEEALKKTLSSRSLNKSTTSSPALNIATHALEQHAEDEHKEEGEDEEDEEEEKRPALSRKKDFLMVTSEVITNEQGDLQKRTVLFQAKDADFSVARFSKHYSDEELQYHHNMQSPSYRQNIVRHVNHGEYDFDADDQLSEMINEIVAEDYDESEDELESENASTKKAKNIRSAPKLLLGQRKRSAASSSTSLRSNRSGTSSTLSIHVCDSDSDYSDVEEDVNIQETFDELIVTPKHMKERDLDEELMPLPRENECFSPTHSEEELVPQVIASDVRENLDLGLRIGYGSYKGKRSTMEDRMTSILNYTESYDAQDFFASNVPSCAYFGIFDGHNGADTAQQLKDKLHEYIFDSASTMQSLAVHPIETLGEAIFNGFDEMDQDLLEQDHVRLETLMSRKREQSQDLDTGLKAGQAITFSGSTAVVAILFHSMAMDSHIQSPSCVHLFVANVGDCRAVLCRNNGIALDLTSDHKAALPSERKRIEDAGGFVHNSRLNGVLAISRAFGDIVHKTDQQLIALPDVISQHITEEDEFILLASDGLFDIMTSEQAINFVMRKLRIHGDVQLAAQELVAKAMALLSHDNISVQILCLNQMDSFDFFDE